MATEEDLKKADESDEPTEPLGEPALPSPSAHPAPLAKGGTGEEEALAEGEPDVPVQLGYQRYVYAAYMAGALLAAFLLAKIGHTAWYRLGQWKPELGEPKDELLYPVA